MIGNLKNTIEILKKYNLYTKKKVGQNFLIDENILKKIGEVSGLDKETGVIEIGPGLGSLTEVLAINAKKVLSYDIDEDMITVLKDVLKDYDNVEVRHKDFLKVCLCEDLKIFRDCKNIKIVSNLPYYITTPIIFKLLSDQLPICEYYFMVQKELALRLTAKTNTKDYNALSVLMRYKTDTSILFDVSRNAFLPMPNVDSCFIKMSLVKRDLGIENEAHFGAYIQNIFASRRKTLVNNLNSSYGFNKEKLNTLITDFGYDFRVRAENLELEEIVKIYLKLIDDVDNLRE